MLQCLQDRIVLAYTYMHTYIYIYIYIHTCTHIHLYTCSYVCVLLRSFMHILLYKQGSAWGQSPGLYEEAQRCLPPSKARVLRREDPWALEIRVLEGVGASAFRKPKHYAEMPKLIRSLTDPPSTPYLIPRL